MTRQRGAPARRFQRIFQTNRRRLLAAAGLTCLLLLAVAPTVLAHAALLRSEPAANAVLAISPPEVRLWLSEPMVAGISGMQVLDAQGNQVPHDPAAVTGADSTELAIVLPPLANGTYLVSWRAFSAVDGHTTEGSFPFSIGVAGVITAGASAEASTSPVAILWRWLLLLSQAAVAGAITFRWWVWRPAVRAAAELDEDAVQLPLSLPYLRVVLGLAAVGATGLFLHQLLQATGGTFADLLGGRVPFGAVLGSRLGTAWLGRLATLSGLAIISADIVSLTPNPGLALTPAPSPVREQRERERGWPEAKGEGPWPAIVRYGSLWLAGLLLYFTTASSHSAALSGSTWLSWPVAADWTHLAATALWAGGLLQFLIVVPGAVRRMGDPAARARLTRELVFRYSTVAAFGVGLMLLSGIYLGALHVGGWARLFDSAYGQTLLIKIALVVVMLLLGAANLLWVKPGLAHGLALTPDPSPVRSERERGSPQAPGEVRFWRIVAAEAVTGILVLAAAGWLTELPRGADATTLGSGSLRLAAQAEDVRVNLTLSPARQGPNQFDVSLSPAAPATVSLRFTSLDRALGMTEVLMDETGPGEYSTTNASLNLAGAWRIETIVRRPDAYDAFAQFEVFVRPDGRIAAGTESSSFVQVFVPFAGLFAGLALIAGATGWLLIAGRAAGGRYSYYGLLVFALVAAFTGGRVLLRFFSDTTPGSLLINPARPDAIGLVTGQTIYQERCSECHGQKGEGDGPLAIGLDPRPPQPFATGRAARAEDGDLFWWIQNGVSGSAMPAFRTVLSDDQTWNVVNYLKTLGAGAQNPSAQGTLVALPPTPTPPGGTLPTPGQSEEAAIALLDRIELAMSALNTLREVQTVTDDTGLSQTFTYEYLAPDRLRYASAGGQEVIVIGSTQYYRIGDGAWQTSQGALDYTFPPTHGYTQNAVGARYEGKGTLDGRPVEIVSFADSTLPAAYRLWVDVENQRILQLAMEGPNHHMVARYDKFDEPLEIEAPPGG